jgi:GLPGLI family protein
MIFTDRFGTGTFTYNQNLDTFDWKLQEEQKEILGYHCKKSSNGFCGKNLCCMVYHRISIMMGHTNSWFFRFNLSI